MQKKSIFLWEIWKLPSKWNPKNATRTDGNIGKAIPLEAWTGPEGSKRARLPDFKTIGT
jgi:hypothetical protein